MRVLVGMPFPFMSIRQFLYFFCHFLAFVAHDVHISPISLASVDTCGCTLDSHNCLVVYLVGMLNPGLNLCPQ